MSSRSDEPKEPVKLYCPNSATCCMHLTLFTANKLFLPLTSWTAINLHHWLMKDNDVLLWKVMPKLCNRILYKTQTLAQFDKRFSNPYYKSSLLELLSQNYCMWPTEWNLEHKTEQTTIKWRTLNSKCNVAVFSLLCIPFQRFSLPQFHTSCKVCLMLDASWSHTSHFVSTWAELIYAL